MGGSKSKQVSGSTAPRIHSRRSTLLSPEKLVTSQTSQSRGREVEPPLLGPAKRSERRYLRTYEVDDDILEGSGGGGAGGGVDGAAGRSSEDAGGRGRTGRRHGGEDAGAVDIDQAIDRYDYLIAFPNPREMGSRRRHAFDEEEGKEDSLSRAGRYSELAATDEASDCDSEDERAGRARITLAEVNNIWYSAVPGDEVVKTAAKEGLAREWEARFRTQADEAQEVSISRSEWVRLAREVIINTLFAKSGLQLKLTLSRQRDQVLCRIRAPIVLLERQAAREKYPLQFRGEVDPGEAFWTEEEIEEEQRVLGKDEANETLEKLYQAERISPNDLAVFDEEVAPNQWSRRVHALERIADRVPVTNRYPAYAEYGNEDRHRHLFQTYPSVGGRTIFRAKDRLALTKSIISVFFDMGVLKARGVVDAVCALHDANRGEAITTEVLQKRWTLGFCRDSSDRIGAPMLSMKMMDSGHSAPWPLRLFCQPLNDIRDYFGEKVAFYFAWLGFYGWALLVPALCGVAVEVYVLREGITFNETGWDAAQVAMAVGVVLWGTVHQELWAREEKVIAVKWGTAGFEEAEKDRPDFEGDRDRQDGGRRRSPVTNTYETYYPDGKRKVRQALGLVVVLFFVIVVLGLVWLVEWLEHYVEVDLGFSSWGGVATSVLSSVQIQILSSIYSRVVKRLNDAENYRTETAYENNLIFKTFLFQMPNNYAALFYAAFIEDYEYGCNTSCIDEVRTLLLAIFCVRFVMVGMEVGIPLMKSRASAPTKAGSTTEKVDEHGSGASLSGFAGGRARTQASTKKDIRETGVLTMNDRRCAESDRDAVIPCCFCAIFIVPFIPRVKGKPLPGGGSSSSPSSNTRGRVIRATGAATGLNTDDEPIEVELRLPEYDGPFSDYCAIVLQYGYVTMFVCALPALTFLAMAEVIVQIRTDSYKLVSLMRRPDPEMAEGVGMWSALMDAMGALSVLTNTAIICFTSGTLADQTIETSFLIWLAFEHALLLLKVIVHVIIPDQAEFLTIIKARQRFLVLKHLHGFMHDDNGDDISGVAGESQRRGNLDIVGLHFDAKQRGRRLSPNSMAQLGRLRTELRDITRGLKVVKEQLQGAYQYESFNEQTGIGETKHGLPLGCLNIKLICLDGMEGEPQATTILISLRNSRQGDKTPPGPALQASRPAERGRRGVSGAGPAAEGGAMVFSQVFVLAPIRTQDAEIVFDVTQASRGYGSAALRASGTEGGGAGQRGSTRRVGTCRISLRELADQREHELPMIVLKKINNRWAPSDARLYVKIKFMYSKVVPLRNRIYALQDRKRSIEKELTLLQIGGRGDDAYP